MIARLSSLVIWALVAVAAVAWGLRLAGRAEPVPPHAKPAAAAVPQAGDFSRALGLPPSRPVEQAVAAPAVNNDARFQLIGVVAPGAGRAEGLALIAVDGKIARTVRTGRELEPGLVLKAVSHRRAELAAAGRPPLVLELPALPEPQRGRPDGTAPSPGAPLPGQARVPGAPGAPPALPTMPAAPPSATPPTGMTPPQRGPSFGMAPVAAMPQPVNPEAAPVVADVPTTDGQAIPQR